MDDIKDSKNAREELLVFDKDGSLWRLGGDEELYQELVGVFVEEAPDVLTKIKSFFENRDFLSLEHESHALKGSASAVGAILVSDAASKLEMAAKNNEDSKMIFLLINKIEDEVKRADAYLKKRVE